MLKTRIKIDISFIEVFISVGLIELVFASENAGSGGIKTGRGEPTGNQTDKGVSC